MRWFNPAIGNPALRAELGERYLGALDGAVGPTLYGAEWLDGEDVIFATVDVLDVPHHVTFVRVTVDESTGEQIGTRDPHRRLDHVLAGAEGAAETVVLPGINGEWVCGIDPQRS